MNARCESRSQVWRGKEAAAEAPGVAAGSGLQNLCQFGRKGATRRLFAVPAATFLTVGTLLDSSCIGSSGGGGNRCLWPAHILPFWRLRRIRTQKPVFQRGAVEASNDRLHLVRCRRFDKSEALGFLRFVVTDHLYCIGH
jgi:hypothetical protein